MIIVVILLALAFLAVLAVILLRRAGGGRFPWLQFYMKGRESGFIFHEINLLRRVSVEAKLENPTALFWSIKQLDRAIKGIIIKYRARSQEQDPEYNLLLSKLFELRKRVEFDQPKYKLGIKSSRKLIAEAGAAHHAPRPRALRRPSSSRTSPATWPFPIPRGPKLPDGFSWKNQKIGVYFWRAEDAGYFFQTKVLEDFIDRKYPILHIAHSDNLIRTQKRNSLRVETDMPAELFPLKSIDQANEMPEEARGLRCRLADLSEGGAAILIGGKARVGPSRQDPVHPRGHPGGHVRRGEGHQLRPEEEPLAPAHAGAPPSVTMRNRILTYVYNLFGERETIVAGEEARSVRRERAARKASC